MLARELYGPELRQSLQFSNNSLPGQYAEDGSSGIQALLLTESDFRALIRIRYLTLPTAVRIIPKAGALRPGFCLMEGPMHTKTRSLLRTQTLLKPLGLFLGLLIGATLLSAGDKPWKARTYQQWDEKDLQAILSDSPWVRVTQIQRSWLPVAEKDVPPAPQIAGGVRQMPAAGTSENTARAGEESLRQLNVQVFWQSSRVMRAATAREAVLHGQQLDVDKYVAEPQSEYQIILRMADMTPFSRQDEKSFQDNSFLQTKKSKDKILPTHVVYERNEKGSVQDAIFFFPKTNSSGSPTISSDEKEVQFSCKIADQTVRVGFRPQEMVDQSGPAL